MQNRNAADVLRHFHPGCAFSHGWLILRPIHEVTYSMTDRNERRAVRRQQRAELALLKIPFHPPHNPLPPTAWVTPEQIEQLHLASLRILEETGIDMLDDETIALWITAGARVDQQRCRVWIDRGAFVRAGGQGTLNFYLAGAQPDL
jgi:trimethylamine--corrinoid protein Co-methyltransferase